MTKALDALVAKWRHESDEWGSTVTGVVLGNCAADLSAAIQADAVGVHPIDWRKYNDDMEAYVDDYEFIGETEDGRDACYQPTERERLLILDALRGWQPLPTTPKEAAP